ncbi:DUF4389 domain-containing protein [Trichloromonas sp.]|uniref:DUF4389 domain-containing protein n=1 Tax=Trichloromonas sp. TaxID=3069249 RepID=UPI002A4DA973|nr:DUF4389 domain-containing protein [Trichloromonas sp.]
MTDSHEIIRFIDDYLREHDLEGLAVAEAARLLNDAGFLLDDGQNPGEPLRKLLREGGIPHARKEQGRWFIPASSAIASEEPEAVAAVAGVGRLKILLRLLYAFLFLLVFEILRLIVQVTVLGQYLYLLVVGTSCEPLRTFGSRVADYSYRVIRYLTLNENERPYPFTQFPGEIEPPEPKLRF